MKFYAPKPRKTNESVSEYTGKCNIWLVMFKRMLKIKINGSRLMSCKNRLFREPNIQWTITEPEYDIVYILEEYLNNLQCVYDSRTSHCYYAVPNTIRCPNTTTSLDTVVRTLEYGGVNIAPLYWIRPVFREFIKITNDR